MTVQSMGTPGNPLFGSGGTMVRELLRSKNYVPGVSGWIIRADGTVEFQGATIRGEGIFGTPGGERVEISSTGVIKIYNSANDLVIQIDETGFYLQDSTSGSAFTLTYTGGRTLAALQPKLVTGQSITPGYVFSESSATFADAWLDLFSPQINGGAAAEIILFGQNVLNPTDPETQIQCNAESIYLNGDNPVGRGIHGYVGDVNDSAASTAEQVILTIPSKTYLANRLYELKTTGRIAPAAAATPLMQVRKTNLAGAIAFVIGRVDCSAAQEFAPPPPIFFKVGATNVTTALALTLNGGGVSTRHESSSVGRSFSIWDVGAARTMPDVVTLT